jgi:hypothetical protein
LMTISAPNISLAAMMPLLDAEFCTAIARRRERAKLMR